MYIYYCEKQYLTWVSLKISVILLNTHTYINMYGIRVLVDDIYIL